MPEFEIDGTKYLIDEDGYLETPERWSDKVAEFIASREGISSLTEAHWKIIDYVKEYHIVHGIAPTMRRIINSTEYSGDEVLKMFNSNPSSIGKVCGMQNPAICT